MPIPLEKFVKQLEDSGILAGETLKDFIAPNALPKDAEELARELIRHKKLTKFQAEEVSRGKGQSLVLGNYVLMEQIGAGGMGQVFKAEHRRMKRIGTEACSTPPRFPSTIRLSLTARPSRKRRKGEGGSSILADH